MFNVQVPVVFSIKDELSENPKKKTIVIVMIIASDPRGSST